MCYLARPPTFLLPPFVICYIPVTRKGHRTVQWPFGTTHIYSLVALNESIIFSKISQTLVKGFFYTPCIYSILAGGT